VIESFNTVRSRVILVLISGLQILHRAHAQLNISMRTLRRSTYAVWILAMIILVYGLVGCASVQSTVDNGVGELPGQRVYVNTTVYRW
jgi:choline-glycine betaine transporter